MFEIWTSHNIYFPIEFPYLGGHNIKKMLKHLYVLKNFDALLQEYFHFPCTKYISYKTN
jgi:hypothetical protein